MWPSKLINLTVNSSTFIITNDMQCRKVSVASAGTSAGNITITTDNSIIGMVNSSSYTNGVVLAQSEAWAWDAGSMSLGKVTIACDASTIARISLGLY
jgi:hypothetical protein